MALEPAEDGDPEALPDHSAAHARASRTTIASLLKVGFLALVVAFAVYFIWKNRHDVGEALTRVSVGAIIGALALGLGGIWLGGPAWRELLAGLGSRLRQLDAQRIFFIGQLGKYIPGGVWTVVAQASMAKEFNVPRTRSGTASVMTIVLGVVTGGVLGAACLAASGRAILGEYWWAVLLLLPLVTLLHPGVLAWASRMAGRITGRTIAVERIPTRSLLLSVGLMTASQILVGLQFYVLAGGVGVTSPPDVLLAVGLFAFATAAGIMVPFAPAGAGVREAILALGLSRFMDVGSALLVVLLSRLVLTVVDVLLAAAFAMVRRRMAGAPAEHGSPGSVGG